MSGGLVTTGDGSLSLVHPEHGESYHSHFGALAEAQRLYIEASGFLNHCQNYQSDREQSVLDIGLGLGYNGVTTLATWRDSPSPATLTLISLENDATLFAELKTGQARWQENWPRLWKTWVQSLEQKQENLWGATFVHPNHRVSFQWWIFLGDAQSIEFQKIKEVSTPFHYIWQDAFSIEKCPELWTPSWFKKLETHSDQNCTLMTYSVAKIVRLSLEEGGWNWKKIPASSAKKSWLLAKPKRRTEFTN